MHYVGHRTSDTNPLRSMPMFRTRAAVLGWTPVEAARIVVEQCEQGLPMCRARLQLAHQALGRANRIRFPGLRRTAQAEAMRGINMARRALLDGHRELATARAELERLENQPELPFAVPASAGPREPQPGFPSIPRVLREDTGEFPRGTVAVVDRAKAGGWHATIILPRKAGGIASHHDSYAAAQAWMDAALAAAVLH